MARRRKSNPFEDLLGIAKLLPWWVCGALAILSFFVCHGLATMEVHATKTSAGVVVPQILPIFIKGFAFVGQFVLPLIFLAGGLISAVGRAVRKRVAPIVSQPFVDLGVAVASGVLDTIRSKRERGRSEPFLGGGSPARIDASDWSLALLHALEWKRFEQVCAGLFEHLGFFTKSATTGPDGGVDIHLFRPPATEAVAVVQCKSWTGTSKVGVRLIRELHGVMASMRISEGIFAATTTFTEDAKEYAKSNHIDLMDGETILRSIRALTGEQQRDLLQFATAGDYTTPSCPSCGIKMIRRSPSSGGKQFWGCVNFPCCRTIINIANS